MRPCFRGGLEPAWAGRSPQGLQRPPGGARGDWARGEAQPLGSEQHTLRGGKSPRASCWGGQGFVGPSFQFSLLSRMLQLPAPSSQGLIPHLTPERHSASAS